VPFASIVKTLFPRMKAIRPSLPGHVACADGAIANVAPITTAAAQKVSLLIIAPLALMGRLGAPGIAG
jgi:hypothetical protein